MRRALCILFFAILVSGCSESPEDIGVGISSRLASPIEQAKEVSDKAQQTRGIELPE